VHSRILPEESRAVYSRCAEIFILCCRDRLAFGVLRGDVVVYELLKSNRKFVVGTFERSEFLAVDVNGAARRLTRSGKTDADVCGFRFARAINNAAHHSEL